MPEDFFPRNFASKPWAQALVSAGALAGLTSVLLVFQLGQPLFLWPWHGMACCRDISPVIHPRYRTPDVTTIWTGLVVGGVAMLTDIGSLADLTNIGTLFAFVLVCCGVVILRRKESHAATAIPRAVRTGVSTAGCAFVFPSDAQSSNRNLVAFLRLADHRPGNLFPVQCAPQPPSDGNRCREKMQNVYPPIEPEHQLLFRLRIWRIRMEMFIEECLHRFVESEFVFFVMKTVAFVLLTMYSTSTPRFFNPFTI